MNQDNKNEFTFELARTIIGSFSLNKILFLNASTFGIFGRLKGKSIKEIKEDPFYSLDEIDDKYDFIVGDLPLGLLKGEWVDESKKIKIKEKKNWLTIFKSLFFLAENGFGLFLVEPNFCESVAGQKFTNQLKKFGFYINAVFHTPENFLRPHTSLRPILILISRNQENQYFIAELNDAPDISLIINNFKLKNYKSKTLQQGMYTDKFTSFERYKTLRLLEKLSTQYKEYKNYKLQDISTEINLSKEFKDKSNTIYIPKIGNSPVITNLKEARLKHQNYFQVKLKKNIVESEYMRMFFKSDMGRFILQSVVSGSFIPIINKKDIEQIMVPVPPLIEQNDIIQTDKKLLNLKGVIYQLEKELALNPRNSEIIQDKLDSLLGSLNLLSNADKIFSLIRMGESKTIEFKQTLSCNIHTKQKDKEIEKSALKTVVAFLNSDGGNLLIGVKDDGVIYSIENDFYKSNDDYLKHFHNLIRDKIGEPFYPLIDYRIVKIQDKKVLFVECQKSDTPCYFEQNEFFVRINPATDKLEGPRLVEYIKKRFKSY